MTAKRDRGRLDRLWEEQLGLCYWCGRECYPRGDPRRQTPTGTLSGKAATVDHLYPRGHPQRTSPQYHPGKPRKVMACSTCNGLRGQRAPDEFRMWINARIAGRGGARLVFDSRGA